MWLIGEDVTKQADTDKKRDESIALTWWAELRKSKGYQGFCKVCKGLREILMVLATLAGLVAFISLYFTIQHFEIQQRQALIETTQARLNQFMALGIEAEENIATCKSLLESEKEYLNGETIPFAVFLHASLGEILQTGAINDELLQALDHDTLDSIYPDERRFNVTLMNCYHKLVTANQLIEAGISLNNLGAVTKLDLSTAQLAYDQSLELVQHLMDDVRYIEKRLELSLPELRKISDHQKSVLDSLIAEEGDD